MSEQIARFHADHDAFGHHLADFFQDPENGDPIEIIERDDGYISGDPLVPYYISEWGDWPPYEQQALAALTPGRVLDVGCGAGRVGLHLQSLGFSVVGIDNSPLALEVSRQRGLADARQLSITQVDGRLGTFDAILMMGNNWGLFGSRERARHLLRRFYRITTPGAKMLVESNDVYQTNDPVHLAYHAWNRERGRMPGQIRMRVRYQIYRSLWFDYLMVSQDEMAEILEGTGWRIAQVFPSEWSYYAAILEKSA